MSLREQKRSTKRGSTILIASYQATNEYSVLSVKEMSSSATK